ncbi:MAG: TIGR04255 family protein [Thermoguttaceae bacterium]
MLAGKDTPPMDVRIGNLGRIIPRTQMEQSPLPNYKCPPVVETVLGVQFGRIDGFTNGHLGKFWALLDRNEWPLSVDAPRLPPQRERFDASVWAQIGPQLTFSQDVSTRLQITNKDRNRMIQMQSDRFHFNWVGESGEEYPRYEKVRSGFEQAYRSFVEFATQGNVSALLPNQWEVTYVNHIPEGTVWSTPDDWGNFFRLLSPSPVDAAFVELESFTGEWRFIIPEKRGRLHVEWRRGSKKTRDDTEQNIVSLTFTARGPIPRTEDIFGGTLAGLDLGHDTIVRSFQRLMSDEANKVWGLQNVD